MTNPTANRAEGAPRRTPEPWHGITGECYCDGTPHGKDACTTIDAETVDDASRTSDRQTADVIKSIRLDEVRPGMVLAQGQQRERRFTVTKTERLKHLPRTVYVTYDMGDGREHTMRAPGYYPVSIVEAEAKPTEASANAARMDRPAQSEGSMPTLEPKSHVEWPVQVSDRSTERWSGV